MFLSIYCFFWLGFVVGSPLYLVWFACFLLTLSRYWIEKQKKQKSLTVGFFSFENDFKSLSLGLVVSLLFCFTLLKTNWPQTSKTIVLFAVDTYVLYFMFANNGQFRRDEVLQIILMIKIFKLHISKTVNMIDQVF